MSPQEPMDSLLLHSEPSLQHLFRLHLLSALPLSRSQLLLFSNPTMTTMRLSLSSLLHSLTPTPSSTPMTPHTETSDSTRTEPTLDPKELFPMPVMFQPVPTVTESIPSSTPMTPHTETSDSTR